MPIPPSAQAVLDTVPEKVFDTLTQLACRLLKVPVALVTILDEDRQFFKSQQGLPEPWASQRETPLSHSFCQHVAATSQPLIVEDARTDPRVANNLAVPELGVISYLGVPLFDEDKRTYGALCAIGNEPRQWSAADVETLEAIAAQVMGEIALRTQFRAYQETQRQERLLAAAVQGDYDRLAAIFQQSPSFLAILRGPDHVFHLANEQYERITGHRELLGKPTREALPEVAAQGYVELLDRVYTTGEPHVGKDVRILLQSEPGAPLQEHFIDFVYQPTRREDGSIDGIVVHGVDWTERKRAQQEAGGLSEQRRLALDSARVGWWHVDVASGQIDMDERFRAIFDVDAQHDAYAQVLERVHPEDRERVDAAVQAAVRPLDPVPYAIEYRVIRRDHSLRWVAARGQASHHGEDPGQRINGLSGTATDITDEKTAHETLRAERELLRTVFDQAPDDAILVMDVERRLTAWNPAAERVTGWTAAEAVGQAADLIFSPEDRAAGVPAQETESAAREGKASDERWHVRKNGSRFWGSGTMNALHDAEGGVRGFLKVFRDATVRHEEAETLSFLSRMTDAVLGERDPERIIEIVQRMLGEHLRASRVLFAEAIDEGRQVVVRQAWAPSWPSLVGTHQVADFGEAFVADVAAGRAHVSRHAEDDYAPGPPLEAVRAIGAMAGVSVPVIIGGQLQMVVVVHQATPRDWTAGEVALIRQVADRMVAEVQRAKAEAALQASDARGAYLIRLSDALRPLLAPAEVQAVAAHTLGERLGVNRVAYFEIVDGNYVIDQDYAIGVASFVGQHPVVPFGPLILEQLLAGQVVTETDTSTIPGRSADERAAFAALGIGSIATVPLVKGGKFVAGLTAQTIGPRVWSPADLWAIAETAERTWSAVERARSERSLRAKEAASRFLSDLGEATRRMVDPDAVLGTVVDALRVQLSADRCAYVEVEENQDAITIRYDRVNPDSNTHSLAGRYRLSDFGQRMPPALRAGRTVVVADFATDEPFADAKDAMAAVGVAALVNVPLVKAGRLVAILAVNESRPRAWTADEVALIEAVAERSWGEVERSRVAHALAFERHQLELIFRESPAAMATWRGEDLVFERVNPEYQDVFRGRQLVGRPLLEACPELAGQGFDELLREVLHTGKPFVGREVLAKVQKDKDGPVEDRYFDFSYLQIVSPDGQPWGVYDHAVDVTDRVRNRLAVEQSQRELHRALADRQNLLEAEQAARTEAERTSQLKDEFLATLSHELRTPLNAILGWTQVLRDDPNLSEDTAGGLATIERNAKAQTQIIEDLLDMSKIISGKVRLDVQPLHLDQVVTAAVDTMRPAAAAKGIRLQALIDPQARMISGDPNRLQQVFWNLLTNAIKFTPKGGKVQVVLERVDSHLEVCVADTGEGIAPEFLPYVFDRFRQQDASTTRKHGGLGLGLAIVKQLVELHGGSINAKSTGLGHGTTFCVHLPLSAVQPAREEADPQRRHPQSEQIALSLPAELLDLAGVKVLVVDDELDARLLVKRLLEDRKATVHAAGSVAEALTVLQAERPDVLVSDIGMPGEDGYALIRQVRALPPEDGGSTPAVALTAYARAEDRLKAILAGFEMHVSKPVNTVELLALVAKLSGRTANL